MGYYVTAKHTVLLSQIGRFSDSHNGDNIGDYSKSGKKINNWNGDNDIEVSERTNKRETKTVQIRCSSSASDSKFQTYSIGT